MAHDAIPLYQLLFRGYLIIEMGSRAPQGDTGAARHSY